MIEAWNRIPEWFSKFTIPIKEKGILKSYLKLVIQKHLNLQK